MTTASMVASTGYGELAMATATNGVDTQAVKRAEQLLDESIAAMTRRRRQQRRLAVVVADPAARELTFVLTDEVLRMTHARPAARRLRAIVATVGVPLVRDDRPSFVACRCCAVVRCAIGRHPPCAVADHREGDGVALADINPAFGVTSPVGAVTGFESTSTCWVKPSCPMAKPTSGSTWCASAYCDPTSTTSP